MHREKEIAGACLNDAKALSQSIAKSWPLQASCISSAPPLWKDALVPVFGAWADVCVQAIGWLDQVPLVMVEAEQKSNETDTLVAYQNISAKLDALLKDVLTPLPGQNGSGFRLDFGGGQQVAPLSRLEKILEEKHALDALSGERLKSIRAGLSLGEQARQLAAIVSEALPALRGELDEQVVTLGLEDVRSLVDAQRQTQRRKAFERACSSLDLVSLRLAQEFSSPSLINQDQLEESLVQEAFMRSRLNALSTQIAQRIAVEKVNANTALQVQRLPSIAPVSKPAAIKCVSIPQEPALIMSSYISSDTISHPFVPRKKLPRNQTPVVFNNVIASEDGSELSNTPIARLMAFLMLAFLVMLVVWSVLS